MKDASSKERSPRESAVLITGSSSGIGLALAEEFAKHGHPVLLAAPVESEIKAVARRIAADFDVPAEGFACDLTQPDAPETLQRTVKAAGHEVEILVNNAGLGRHGKLWEVDLEDHLRMLRLNAEAVLRAMRLHLPDMVARGHGRILNTASVAGFEPAPLMATYHATKAFVLSLSEAVAVELKGTGVTLTALCPGPIDTDFFTKADIVDTKAFQDAHVMAPQEVAEAAYPALMAGDPVIVPGTANKAMVFSRRIMPIGAQAKMNEKLYSEKPPSKRKRERGDVESKAAGKS